jgi:hypothetical protein
MTPETPRSEPGGTAKPPGGMTKTRAARLARQALQHGYLDTPAGLRVNCPLCREHVTTARNYREFPARPGKPANVRADGSRYTYRRETAVEALDRAVTGHLAQWCEAAA